MKLYYVYVLKTTKCRKVYVGITVNPKNRERQHKAVAKLMWKQLTKCGRAVKRYGPETFSLVVKASTPDPLEAAKIEKEWIKRFGPKRLWNSSVGGEYSENKCAQRKRSKNDSSLSA